MRASATSGAGPCPHAACHQAAAAAALTSTGEARFTAAGGGVLARMIPREGPRAADHWQSRAGGSLALVAGGSVRGLSPTGDVASAHVGGPGSV